MATWHDHELNISLFSFIININTAVFSMTSAVAKVLTRHSSTAHLSLYTVRLLYSTDT